MTYELCKKLKDAGFPQKDSVRYIFMLDRSDQVYVPELSELIEVCRDSFWKLEIHGGSGGGENGIMIENLPGPWFAYSHKLELAGSTPEEAVAQLWLELQKQHGND